MSHVCDGSDDSRQKLTSIAYKIFCTYKGQSYILRQCLGSFHELNLIALFYVFKVFCSMHGTFNIHSLFIYLF